MIVVFLAEGFEEIEGIATVDVLRRAGLETVTVGIGGGRISGAHGVAVWPDRVDRLPDEAPDAIVLPGGMAGMRHLDESPLVHTAIKEAAARGALVCAICAAPTILGRMGLLEGRRAVCYPGMEGELKGAIVQKDAVVEDGNFITAVGPGASVEFGLTIAGRFRSEDYMEKLRESLQCR